MPAVPAMSAVAVEHVHQRAGEQKQERQVWNYVCSVFGIKEVTGDQQESPENPTAITAGAGWMIAVRMFSHSVR